MVTNVTSIWKSVNPYDIPVGKYKGRWSGYIVITNINGINYELQVDKGIRGLNVPCWVIFDARTVTVETIK